MNKLKIAFIGGGINSVVGSAHFSALNLNTNFELMAGSFSRNKEVNQKTGQYYNLPMNQIYNSSDELITELKKEIDGIIILTPTDQHTKQVIDCIENGIPVICEKALSSSIQEVNRIKEIIEKENGYLSVIYNYLGYPIIRELKQKISLGKLGKIIHIQIEMPQESFIKNDSSFNPIIPQKWRLADKSIPTISLDLGVHLHILIKYLVGEIPLNVVSKSESIGNFDCIEDNVNCIIEYSNNITCNMWYSKIASGNRNGLRIRIYGTEGSAEWIQENPELLFCANTQGERWSFDRSHPEAEVSNLKRYERFKVGHPAGFIEALANYYDDIADTIRTFQKTGKCEFTENFGIEKSIEGLKLFDAINRSNKEKKWIKV